MLKRSTAALLVLACLLLGCQYRGANVLVSNDDFLIVKAGPSDNARTLAERYLDDPGMAWVIKGANGNRRVRSGDEVVIPLRNANRAAVFAGGYQKVPILAYHRFSKGASCDKLSISKKSFERHLVYLRDKGYKVIGLRDLAGFLKGETALPEKSVVLTIDDGYGSVYDIAFPVLRRFGYQATVFVYTDFVGSSAGLNWAEMKAMLDSGLIDIQPHSKTHADLTKRLQGEGDAAYRDRIRDEVKLSSRILRRKLGVSIHSFSYPFGAENDELLGILKDEGFDLGVTVTRGGNPAFANPFALRRTQIYCKDDVKALDRKLNVFERISQR